jgi:alcohol dehydrogenase
MKAAQINSYGGPDSIIINDNAAKPIAAEGEALVEVYAAAVNPFDISVTEGAARKMFEPDLPATLGGDVAGVVAAVGGGVSSFEIGQVVYGQANALGGQGSFAEFTPVKASQLAAKPASLDFPSAAAMPLVSVSAYQALIDHMNLQTGQKILIHGGAGGIGSMAIQLAKHLGAYVATTVSATEAEFVKNLGADEIIDYQHKDFTKLLKDYDAVYDTVGGDTNRKSYAILKPGGALVSMVAQPDEALVKQYDVRYTSQFTRVTTERLTKIAELADSGPLKAKIDKIFPLDQTAEALKYQATAHPRGKVIIQVKQ